MASVLYLTDTRYGQRAWEHPSALHRCYHYADGLLAGTQNSNNRNNAVVVPMERVSAQMLKGFEHVVFHRPSYNRRFSHALNCCMQTSVNIHADYDDLVFQPEHARHSPLYINGNRDIAKIRIQFEQNLRAAKCFSRFLVSTRFLQSQLAALFPQANITVLPNSLPRLFHTSASDAAKSKMITIGYFPGSSGHGEDLKSINSALSAVIGKNVRLLVVGRIRKDDYHGLANVIHIPFTRYNNYLELLSLVDVSIAPLVENIFNQSKSAVKLIESVAMGTPIIATEHQDMRDHNNELSTLVIDHRDWQAVLVDKIESIRQESVKHGFSEKAQELARRFSVNSRLPILLEHLECPA